MSDKDVFDLLCSLFAGDGPGLCRFARALGDDALAVELPAESEPVARLSGKLAEELERRGLTDRALDLLYQRFPGRSEDIRAVDHESRVDRYVSWVRQRSAETTQIGGAAPDRLTRLEMMLRHPRPSTADSEAFEVRELFRRGCHAPHVLLLGALGAGKTTVLRKLLHVCAREGGEALGLDPDVVPVKLRLQRFTDRRRGETLWQWMEDEVREHMEPPPAGLAAALQRRRRVLLLVDGLDEVVDVRARDSLCEYLEEQLARPEMAEVRAVVSSSFGDASGGARFGAGFGRVEVCPLAPEQVRAFVGRRFQGSAAEAALGETLLRAIEDPGYVRRRVASMISSPLFLGILCAIVRRGGVVPHDRSTYYEECLRVFVRGPDRGAKPPLELGALLSVAGAVAFDLHRQRAQDSRTSAALFRVVFEHLRALGLESEPRLAAEVLNWLQRSTGLIREVSPRRWSMCHQWVQEHLTALHLARAGESSLGVVSFGDRWWRGVILSLVSTTGRSMCTAVLRGVLAAGDDGAFVSEILDEAAERDPDPLLERLDQIDAAELRAPLLRLLIHYFRGDARVIAAARRLGDDSDVTVRALVQTLLEPASAGGSVVVLFSEQARARALDVIRALRRLGIRVWRDGESGPPDIQSLQAPETLQDALQSASAAIGVADDPPPESVADCLDLFRSVGRPARVFSSSGRDDAALGLARWIDDAQRRSGSVFVPGQKVVVEPVLGCRFLWVPGGTFEMGAEDVSEPVHRVSVGPFWLAEVPLTNTQYEKYLQASRHEEPMAWRDERFKGADKPVVSLTWHDARRLCEWLSRQEEIRSVGVEIRLPTEAQWEFAARGEDGRTFPWGDAPPDGGRAVYGQPMRSTAPVGSCLAGRGPFGHLDLIGNVWEWCLDGWDERAYDRRKGLHSHDPVTSGDADEWRVQRGGSWFDEPPPAAFRLRGWVGMRRPEVGVRLAAVLRSSSP